MIRQRREPNNSHGRQSQPSAQEPLEQKSTAQSKPQQLISEKGVFTGRQLHKAFRDGTDFSVFGVLGEQGAGKSVLLDSILGSQEGEAGCSHLAVQSSQERASRGICLQFNGQEGIIGLDTQAVNSANVLLELEHLRADRPPGMISAANESSPQVAQQVADLQRAVFLLSVCHVVLVVSEGVHSTFMWEFIRTAEALARSVPDIWSTSDAQEQDASLSKQERLAKVVFIHTNVAPEDLQVLQTKRLQTALDKFLEGSGQISQSQDRKSQLTSTRSLHLLPRDQEESRMAGRLGPALQEAIADLVPLLLAAPGLRSERQATEQAWLHGCETVWHRVFDFQEIRESCSIQIDR